MAIQFQYTRLDYQETAVQSIADVLSDVPFSPALRSEANPVFDTIANAETLKSNINEIRSRNDKSIINPVFHDGISDTLIYA